MRSSKSRSRSKANRPRPLGNVVNRVFDSSGPEGKVRGTPQQIIDKYLVLARDAQLSNDRVAAENFLQHAEHYTRMLTEAQRESQREAEARRQAAEQQQGRPRHDERGEPRRQEWGGGAPHGDTPNDADQPTERPTERAERDFAVPHAPDVAVQETNLVETPEGNGGRRRRPRPAQEAASAPVGTEPSDSKPAPKRRAPRRPRAPEASADAHSSDNSKPSAAE